MIPALLITASSPPKESSARTMSILGISFFLIHAAPGDPVAALAGDFVTKEYRDLIIQHYGLDQPLITQSFKYFKNVLNFFFVGLYA